MILLTLYLPCQSVFLKEATMRFHLCAVNKPHHTQRYVTPSLYQSIAWFPSNHPHEKLRQNVIVPKQQVYPAMFVLPLGLHIWWLQQSPLVPQMELLAICVCMFQPVHRYWRLQLDIHTALLLSAEYSDNLYEKHIIYTGCISDNHANFTPCWSFSFCFVLHFQKLSLSCNTEHKSQGKKEYSTQHSKPT